MIDRRITDFIARHHVLTLSTVADGMPHCCNLFYAYDPQRNLFAVTSSDETLHARQARQNPRIAASVVLETRVVGKVQGLQIRGTMMPAEAETLPSVRKVYLGRFPYAAAVKLELWTIRPDFMKLTDNRLGFGKKIVWEDRTKTDSLKDKTIAVTGGTGLVGSHLTAELLREGCSVRLIVRNAGKTDLLKATLRRMGVVDRYDRLEFRQTALNNPHTLREAVRGTQVLFHCAAQVSFDPERADDIVSSNTEITTHIVNSCLECGVGLLVHCSSIATLGEPRHEGEPVTESCTLDSPVGKSAYAISKIYAENIVRRGIAQGLKAVIVNPAIVIGEGNWTSGSSLLIAFGARGGFFYTRGVKSYVDVRDVARAMVLLAQRPETAGSRFILSADSLSFRDFFGIVARAAGRPAPSIPIGKPALRMASKLDERISRMTGREYLLSPSVVENASSRSRHCGELISRTTGFRYTPLHETLKRVTRAYIDEKRNR